MPNPNSTKGTPFPQSVYLDKTFMELQAKNAVLNKALHAGLSMEETIVQLAACNDSLLLQLLDKLAHEPTPRITVSTPDTVHIITKDRSGPGGHGEPGDVYTTLASHQDCYGSGKPCPVFLNKGVAEKYISDNQETLRGCKVESVPAFQPGVTPEVFVKPPRC